MAEIIAAKRSLLIHDVYIAEGQYYTHLITPANKLQSNPNALS